MRCLHKRWKISNQKESFQKQKEFEPNLQILPEPHFSKYDQISSKNHKSIQQVIHTLLKYAFVVKEWINVSSLKFRARSDRRRNGLPKCTF